MRGAQIIALALALSGGRLSAQADAVPGTLKHVIGLYLGGTATEERTDFTTGLEYAYRNSKWKGFGLGVLGQVVFAEETDGIGGVSFSFLTPWRLILEGGPIVTTRGETETMARLGAGYEVVAARWAVTPKAYADFSDLETSVGFGIAFGRRF